MRHVAPEITVANPGAELSDEAIAALAAMLLSATGEAEAAEANKEVK